MGDYVHRLTTALLGSELMPASIRMKLMRRLGFDISVDACIWAGASIRSKKIKIGSGVFINVGENVRIGQFVRIITGTHEIGPPNQRGLIEVLGKPVSIQDGCWVCSGVTILPGVTIGRGCVLAANSVVRETTEANGLYAGIPAKLIRFLDT